MSPKQQVYATISDFFRDTIVICQGRRLQRRRHLNSKLLLECGLTDSIRLRSYYVYLHTQVMGVCSGPSVRPFGPHLISCLSIFCHLSYVNYHAIIPSNTQSFNFDGFYLQCNPLCTIFPRFSWCWKTHKLICPTSSLVVQSLFFFDNLHLNIALLPERNFPWV